MRDVIVVGAGGGGAVVAKELAARGLDVLVIEAGPRHAKPDSEWSHLENDANNPVSGYFRVGPANRDKPAWLRELPQNSFVWQVAGVGGTTVHYYGNCPRAMPGVFHGYAGRDSGAYDRAHEFPFSYSSMIPYYEWAEATLPVQTAAMGAKEEAFLRGAARTGLPLQRSKDTTRASYRPQENAILQPRGTAGKTDDPAKLVHPKARGCTFCGFCFQGCFEPRGAPRNLAAKRSTDNSYAPMALTADAWQRGGKAVTLITDATVTRVDADQASDTTIARGVSWRENETGATQSEQAKVVVLAAGCIEGPRLWLNSGLPNPNGWVGRGLTDHFFDWVIGLMPYYTGSTRGPGSAARVDVPGRGGLENVGLPPALQAFSATFSDAGMAGRYTNDVPHDAAGADALGRRVGNDLRALLAHGIDRLLNVLVITDDDVQFENQVGLSSQLPPDSNGAIARVQVRHRGRTRRTRENREVMARTAVDLLRKAGAQQVLRVGWPSLVLHVQSTMRMGSRPDDSVLDASGEARWVKRLFVADNSALPNALGGPNPTLTTQALATRTAERIFRRYFGGDPWIKREAPVPSTHASVTRAVVERGL
jgi:choline dehydrogenase-like flavoprotein